VDEFRKAVQMGYSLVEVLEFWEYKNTSLNRHQLRSIRRVRKHVPKT
jgi:hypothetical protein